MILCYQTKPVMVIAFLIYEKNNYICRLYLMGKELQYNIKTHNQILNNYVND